MKLWKLAAIKVPQVYKAIITDQRSMQEAKSISNSIGVAIVCSAVVKQKGESVEDVCKTYSQISSINYFVAFTARKPTCV